MRRSVSHFVPHNSFVLRSAACALSIACIATGAAAQTATPPSVTMPMVRDTGWVENTTRAPTIVASFLVSVPGAPSLRLGFGEIVLAGDLARGTGSKLRMVSVADGGTQELDARHCREWHNWSCYFNGDAVQVEIIAEPGTGPNRVTLAEVVVGLSMQADTICGNDDRLPSNDVRQARVLPIGCTTWLINDCGHCFLTAGHCGAGISVVEFNVPLSTSTGALQHPPPEDQYAPDLVSLQFLAGGQGNDWCYYGCYPNPVTGLTPYERQQAAYVLAPASPPYDSSLTIRVTGYGIDTTTPIYNQVQQTATGAYGQTAGTVIQYQVDTTGGNSGSPVVVEQTGLAIGIHTNGGCLPSGDGLNSGTAIENTHLQDVLAQPLGVCAVPCVPSVSTYCTGKTSSQGCVPSIGATGVPSATAGAGSFWIRASSVINHKTGLMFYGIMSDERPFMGGFLCIAAPLVRTASQSSGGNPGAADCSGAFAYDMGARIASGIDVSLHVGTTAYAQYWFRDPASQPYTIGLSNAVRFTIGP
jgi:hypothetical protein